MGKKICFYDTECNSLDKEHGFIQELAWAVFDIESKRLLRSKSALLRWNMHFEVEAGALDVTGLSREYTERVGWPATHVFASFLSDLSECDFLGGHNILEYDNEMITNNIKRSMFSEPKQIKEIPSIDTMKDMPYPPSIKVMNLKHLSYDHGYVLLGAHQALSDTMAAAHIFFKYPFEKVLEIASTPIVSLAAYTAYGDQVAKEKLYKLKFRWNAERRRYERGNFRKFYLDEIVKEYDDNMLLITNGVEEPISPNLVVDGTNQLTLPEQPQVAGQSCPAECGP